MEVSWRYSLVCTMLLNFVLLVTLITALPIPGYANEKNAPVELSRAILRVAGQNIPSVVHVEVSEREDVAIPFLPFENDPFFRYVFDAPKMVRKFKQTLKGMGTGTLIDSQGHILTNNYVVAGATEIRVLLASGKEYSARLVGADPKTDLAVIQISTDAPLSHVIFGDSDKVQVGEWVVAVGHLRSLDQSVTHGIITNTHRKGLVAPSSYRDLLQTNAIINQRNTGGPLLNLNGEVVGINAAIVSELDSFKGIGFAIPANMALRIARELIAHGKVERGWLGFTPQNLTSDMAKSFGMETPKGALVADVVTEGPAEQAGLQRGDVILAYQDRVIPDAETLENEVTASPVGQGVRVIVLRDGKKRILRVKVGSFENVTSILASSVKDRLGVVVGPITIKEREKYGLGSRGGAVIRWLDPKGPLGEVGLEVFDIIVEVDGVAVEKAKEFISLVKSLQPREQIALLVLDHRTGRTGHVQVEIQ